MDRAQPGAKGSLTHNLEAGAAWGQFSDGWIVPSTQPSRPARGETSIDEAALNAFAETSAADSLTVTIDPGEAFVDGWLARDTSTDVDLAASTNGQTVFAGWDVSAVFSENEHANRDAADTVIVGLEAAFQDLDPKVPLWTFDTDGHGTALTDRSSNGWDGQFVNTPEWSAPLEQNGEDIDPQYSLDYTNGYTAAQIDVPATRDGITIVARFTTDTETDGGQALVEADQHLIQIENLASGEGRYRAWSNTSGPANKATPPNGLSAGETYEVVWTYDYGTDMGDFYHNAENIDTYTAGHLDEINPIDEIKTGAYRSGERNLMGRMDRVLMYDRKLTNSEVSDVYNGDAPEAGKIIEYDYTGGAGVTSVVDERDLGSTATPEQLRAQDVLRVPVYASEADIPADLPAGTIVFAQQERSFFAEDGISN